MTDKKALKEDLRIGDLIYSPSGKIQAVVEIRTNVVRLKHWSGKTGNYHTHLCSGIELTEDILIKAGFKKITTKYIILDSIHYQKENIWIFLIDKGFELELDTMDDRFNLCVIYKYLHELQNLWKLLKGEELKIDL